MNQYQVSANGHVFGIYAADTAEDACDLCAQDAGYKSVAHMEEQIGSECEFVAVCVEQ